MQEASRLINQYTQDIYKLTHYPKTKDCPWVNGVVDTEKQYIADINSHKISDDKFREYVDKKEGKKTGFSFIA